jgi:glycosyltransferase involved in cell wall biosynthesis
MQCIKVLFVLRPTMGGIRKQVMGLLQNIRRDLVQPIIVCPAGEAGVSPTEVEGVRVIPMDIRGDLNLVSDYRVSRIIAQIVKTEGVAIIHAHGFKAGLLCLWAGLSRSRTYTIICTFHNQVRRSPNIVKDWLNRFLISTVGRRVDQVAVVSMGIRMEAVELLGLPPDKVTCIYNGVDFTVYQNIKKTGAFRRELGIGENTLLVGTLVRLIPQKGIQILIQAVSMLKKDFPDARFAVVGDGPFRSQLEAEAKAAGVSNYLLFMGFRKDIPGILSELDIFVLPTLEEAFSVALMEAMASGKPVVASEVGGLPELITTETGILVPPGKPDELKNAMYDLMVNPARRLQMGLAGRERVEKHFSIKTMAEGYYQLYKRLVDKEG